MATVSIRYKEFDQSTYKAVILDYSEGEKIFNSGNFVKDWYDYLTFLLMEVFDKQNEIYAIHTSSVDHFIMDGDLYESAWVSTHEETYGKLYYDFEELLKIFDYSWTKLDEVTYEIFVKKGERPTWKEFKEKYKNG